jgi:hypothetical protein
MMVVEIIFIYHKDHRIWSTRRYRYGFESKVLPHTSHHAQIR